MTSTPLTSRTVVRIVTSIQTLEGEGFPVRRPFPSREMDQVDPFLLLDHMGPYRATPGKAKGAPDHPHRGFETVTYMLEGRTEHRDSAGNHGKLGPGDVQWMTAGDGVVHSEMPAPEILEKGGRVQAVQLWVNLPRRDKRIPPRYQDTPSERIPVAKSEDGKVSVKVIAGTALGASAIIDTRTPIFYLHVRVKPGGSFTQAVEPDHNVFAYVLEGAGLFGSNVKPAREGQMALFGMDGESTEIFAKPDGSELSVLLIGGKPLSEPVARYGPFVMNTEEELAQAFEDYRAGRMGHIPTTVSPSPPQLEADS